MNKKVLKYILTLGIGLVSAGVIAYSRGLFSQTELVGIFHILTDSFFAPGFLITGLGALVFVSNEGGFDALAYGMTSFFDIFRKEKKNKFRTFYDYKEARAEKNMPCGFILICGSVILALSMVFYILYRQYV